MLNKLTTINWIQNDEWADENVLNRPIKENLIFNSVYFRNQDDVINYIYEKYLPKFYPLLVKTDILKDYKIFYNKDISNFGFKEGYIKDDNNNWADTVFSKDTLINKSVFNAMLSLINFEIVDLTTQDEFIIKGNLNTHYVEDIKTTIPDTYNLYYYSDDTYYKTANDDTFLNDTDISTFYTLNKMPYIKLSEIPYNDILSFFNDRDNFVFINENGGISQVRLKLKHFFHYSIPIVKHFSYKDYENLNFVQLAQKINNEKEFPLTPFNFYDKKNDITYNISGIPIAYTFMLNTEDLFYGDNSINIYSDKGFDRGSNNKAYNSSTVINYSKTYYIEELKNIDKMLLNKDYTFYGETELSIYAIDTQIGIFDEFKYNIILNEDKTFLINGYINRNDNKYFALNNNFSYYTNYDNIHFSSYTTPNNGGSGENKHNSLSLVPLPTINGYKLIYYNFPNGGIDTAHITPIDINTLGLFEYSGHSINQIYNVHRDITVGYLCGVTVTDSEDGQPYNYNLQISSNNLYQTSEQDEIINIDDFYSNESANGQAPDSSEWNYIIVKVPNKNDLDILKTNNAFIYNRKISLVSKNPYIKAENLIKYNTYYQSTNKDTKGNTYHIDNAYAKINKNVYFVIDYKTGEELKSKEIYNVRLNGRNSSDNDVSITIKEFILTKFNNFYTYGILDNMYLLTIKEDIDNILRDNDITLFNNDFDFTFGDVDLVDSMVLLPDYSPYDDPNDFNYVFYKNYLEALIADTETQMSKVVYDKVKAIGKCYQKTDKQKVELIEHIYKED